MRKCKVKCQKDPTIGIFLKRRLFKDVFWVSHSCTRSSFLQLFGFTHKQTYLVLPHFKFQDFKSLWPYLPIVHVRPNKVRDLSPSVYIQALKTFAGWTDLRKQSFKRPFRCLMKLKYIDVPADWWELIDEEFTRFRSFIGANKGVALAALAIYIHYWTKLAFILTAIIIHPSSISLLSLKFKISRPEGNIVKLVK